MAQDALVSAVQNGVQAIQRLTVTMQSVLPVVQSTATTATAGAETLPAAPAGFLNITLPDGTSAKVPYYNP